MGDIIAKVISSLLTAIYGIFDRKVKENEAEENRTARRALEKRFASVPEAEAETLRVLAAKEKALEDFRAAGTLSDKLRNL